MKPFNIAHLKRMLIKTAELSVFVVAQRALTATSKLLSEIKDNRL